MQPSKTRTKRTADQPLFSVEVRQEVGVVYPDNNGESPVKIGFAIATDYIGEQYNGHNPLNIEFNYDGQRFSVSAQPAE